MITNLIVGVVAFVVGGVFSHFFFKANPQKAAALDQLGADLEARVKALEAKAGIK